MMVVPIAAAVVAVAVVAVAAVAAGQRAHREETRWIWVVIAKRLAQLVPCGL